MHPVTDRFAATVGLSHRLATVVDVLQGDEVIATLTTVTDGAVTLDSKAQVRSRVDLTLVDDGTLALVPSSATDLLAPYGHEIRVSRGITFADGSTELVPLGVFRIDRTDVDDSGPELLVRIAGQDRAARVIDARFEEAFEIASGTNLVTAILALVQDAIPGVAYSVSPTSLTTPKVIAEEGDDRWKLAQDLAKSAGLRLYFDRVGAVSITPDPGGAAVVTLAEGAGGVLLEAAREWSREGAFNRVIATGENTGQAAPARGVATDNDPLSPTYYFGPFGKTPRFYKSQFIVTNTQAQDAAAAMLARELGTTQTVSADSLVLPHLDPGDVARVTRARTGIDEDHVIDTITIPLTAQRVMSWKTRAVQVLA